MVQGRGDGLGLPVLPHHAQILVGSILRHLGFQARILRGPMVDPQVLQPMQPTPRRSQNVDISILVHVGTHRIQIDPTRTSARNALFLPDHSGLIKTVPLHAQRVILSGVAAIVSQEAFSRYQIISSIAIDIGQHQRVCRSQFRIDSVGNPPSRVELLPDQFGICLNLEAEC